MYPKRDRILKVEIPGCISFWKAGREHMFDPLFTSKLFDIKTPLLCVDTIKDLTQLLKDRCLLYKDSAYSNIVLEGPKVNMCSITYKLKCKKDKKDFEYELKISNIYAKVLDLRNLT